MKPTKPKPKRENAPHTGEGGDGKPEDFRLTEWDFGFRWGPVEVYRMWSGKDYVVLRIETRRWNVSSSSGAVMVTAYRDGRVIVTSKGLKWGRYPDDAGK